MSAKRTGRILGTLTVVQLAGLIVPFVLLLPIATGRDYLSAGAAASTQIRLAVLLLFGTAAITVLLTFVLSRVIRKHHGTDALWLVAVATMMTVAQAVDNSLILSMLSLSEQQATGASGLSSLEFANGVGIVRRWTHTTALLAIDVWILSWYLVLRSLAVPRWLIYLGVFTVVLHAIGIPLRGFAGMAPVGEMGMPMAVSHLAIATWFVIKGIDGPARSEASQTP